MTMGTDQPVYTAACVSSALNLPSLLSVGEALSVTNKKHMKTILKEAGIPAARFRFIHQGMEAGSLDGLCLLYTSFNEFKVIIVHFVSLLLLYYYLHCLFVLIFRLSLS